MKNDYYDFEESFFSTKEVWKMIFLCLSLLVFGYFLRFFPINLWALFIATIINITILLFFLLRTLRPFFHERERYKITNEFLEIETGSLKRKYIRIPLSHIESVNFSVDKIQSLFDQGDIIITLSRNYSETEKSSSITSANFNLSLKKSQGEQIKLEDVSSPRSIQEKFYKFMRLNKEK